jgi:hypothetical protein
MEKNKEEDEVRAIYEEDEPIVEEKNIKKILSKNIL